ncbi:LppX_LprAFG lipoprotein [Nocardioides sp. B-3]|nr:LppX_LprAFG lipoprotein [Nocardioides sp. B-3]UUZ58908.1 LppX_LprAFG lipoprotein [Nocardioides sp. B-3]
MTEDQSPEEVLAAAATTLSETSGVSLTLSTEDLPDGVAGIVKADGVATNQPAFEGTITVIFAGQSVQVPVIAVDGKVNAVLPFTDGSYLGHRPRRLRRARPGPARQRRLGLLVAAGRHHRPRGGRERPRRLGQLRGPHDLHRHRPGRRDEERDPELVG